MPTAARPVSGRLPKNSSYHHGDLHRALMEAAIEELSGPEAHALSFRNLARKLGVTTGAPYHHFKDRTELLVLIAAEGYERLSIEMSRAAARTLSYKERVKGLTKAYLGFARKQPGYYTAMFLPEVAAAGEVPELRAAAAKSFDLVCEVIADHAPALSKGDVSERAVSLWSLLHGMLTLSAAGSLGRRLAKQREDKFAVDAVLRLLDGRPLC